MTHRRKLRSNGLAAGWCLRPAHAQLQRQTPSARHDCSVTRLSDACLSAGGSRRCRRPLPVGPFTPFLRRRQRRRRCGAAVAAGCAAAGTVQQPARVRVWPPAVARHPAPRPHDSASPAGLTSRPRRASRLCDRRRRSGKTTLLFHYALNAAAAGQRVFFFCRAAALERSPPLLSAADLAQTEALDAISLRRADVPPAAAPASGARTRPPAHSAAAAAAAAGTLWPEATCAAGAPSHICCPRTPCRMRWSWTTSGTSPAGPRPLPPAPPALSPRPRGGDLC